jgi:hypothetical protein
LGLQQEGWGFALQGVKTVGPQPRMAHGAVAWRNNNPGSSWLTNLEAVMDGTFFERVAKQEARAKKEAA